MCIPSQKHLRQAISPPITKTRMWVLPIRLRISSFVGYSNRKQLLIRSSESRKLIMDSATFIQTRINSTKQKMFHSLTLSQRMYLDPNSQTSKKTRCGNPCYASSAASSNANPLQNTQKVSGWSVRTTTTRIITKKAIRKTIRLKQQNC